MGRQMLPERLSHYNIIINNSCVIILYIPHQDFPDFARQFIVQRNKNIARCTIKNRQQLK